MDILHINPHQFDDVSGSRRLAILAAVRTFEQAVSDQLRDVDPPNGQHAVEAIHRALDRVMLELFPPPAPEATADPPVSTEPVTRSVAVAPRRAKNKGKKR